MKISAWLFLLPFLIVGCSTIDKHHAGEMKPPSRGLNEVSNRQVNLKGGFWGPRIEIHHQNTIPHVLDKLEERHHMRNFDVAAEVLKSGTVVRSAIDTEEGTKALEGNAGNAGPGSANDGESGIVGHSAFDSDVYKALEGACYSCGNCKDPAMEKRIASIRDRILAAQEDDGYLVSYFTAKDPENRWANLRLNHEMYNAGHFFEFAVAHYELTGDPKALEAAKRFADHIDATFGSGKIYGVGGHQGIELALIKLCRVTGEERYLELCRFLLDQRGHIHGIRERKPFTEVIPRGDPPRLPGEDIRDWRRKKWSMRNGRMQDHKPVLEQTEAVGHAVRAGYMYSAMADLARFSEAADYGKAARILWEDVVSHKLYLTGGLGTAQYGDEGFGDPYLLPNKTYCESCANIAHVFWQHRMNLLQGEAKYADMMELPLYNAALSGMALDGKSYFYQNTLESTEGAERREWIGLACCPTNLARFTPQVGGYVYAQDEGKLYVNLYAAGEASVRVDGKPVKLIQETDYPWDGNVSLRVEPDAAMLIDLRLRIPQWLRGGPVPGDIYRYADSSNPAVSLSLNGKPVDFSFGKDGYVSLSRTWKKGDVLELSLPMSVRRVRAHEKMENNTGEVALMRGPMVYCLEAIDNPGVDLFKISLPRDPEFRSQHRPDLLNGVTIIQTTGLDPKGKPVELTAIPYYAWSNRGKSPMRIWLSEAENQ